ncbi:MAG: tetratricopeptide repeat protein, partial [Bryobacteraceae bacterium]
MNETAPLIVDSEALLRLGNDLLHRGRLDEARTTFRQILEQDQTNLKATLALGRLEKRLLDNAAACRLLRAAVTMDPNNLAAWTDLAAVLRDLDQAEEAASIYRKILATNPDHLQSHIGLAWIARASHHQETARAHFTIAAESLRSAAEREPNSLQILTQLATVLRELDRTDEAVAIYRNILAQNPGHLQSHL